MTEEVGRARKNENGFQSLCVYAFHLKNQNKKKRNVVDGAENR